MSDLQREIRVDDEIELKEIGLGDVERIYQLLVQERGYFSEFLAFVEGTKDLCDTQSFVESVIESDQTNLTCGVYYQDKFVGLVGLKDADTVNKKAEIGYWLSENYQKLGIMNRACKALLNYAFDNLDLNRIQLKAAVENMKSQQVAERLGFKREGILREAELHARGFVDFVLYSMLRSEKDILR